MGIKRKVKNTIMVFFTILSVIFAGVTAFSLSAEGAEEWLPKHSNWLDSAKEMIPKENSFSPMWTSKTKIKSFSKGIYWDKAGQGKFSENMNSIPISTKEAQWIVFSDVGYYHQKPINMKMTVKPEKQSENDAEYLSTIEIKEGMGSVYFDKDVNSFKLTYEFFDNEDRPIDVSGYWSFRNVTNNKYFKLKKNWVKNIYSVNRSFKENSIAQPIMVKYSEDATYLNVIGMSKREELIGDRDSLQSQLIITYDNQSKLEYVVQNVPNIFYANFGFSYNNKIVPKIEFPDPSSFEQKIDETFKREY